MVGGIFRQKSTVEGKNSSVDAPVALHRGQGGAGTGLQGAQRQGGEPPRVPFLAFVTKKSQLPRWNGGSV